MDIEKATKDLISKGLSAHMQSPEFKKEFDKLVEKRAKEITDEQLKKARMQNVLTVKQEKELEPGIKAARYIKGVIVGLIFRKNGVAGFEQGAMSELAIKAIEHIYGDSDAAYVAETKSVVEKMKAKALSASADGGFLIPEEYASEVIPLLFKNSTLIAAGSKVVPMKNGVMNFPKQISGPRAQYVGENQSANAINGKFANVKLTAKKLLSFSVISNDMLLSNNYRADDLVLGTMVEDMQEAMDYNGFYGDGTDASPLGIHTSCVANDRVIDLRFEADGTTPRLFTGDDLVTNTAMQIETNDVTNNDDTFGNQLSPLAYSRLWVERDGVGGRLNRDEMKTGRLSQVRLHKTTQIADVLVVGGNADGWIESTIIVGKFSDHIIGEQAQLTVDISTEATYLNEEGQSVSAFANDQQVLRGKMKNDMAIARKESFIALKVLVAKPNWSQQ